MCESDKLIKLYFQLGFSNKEIQSMLAETDGIIISISTLKRKLKACGLFRRKNYSDIYDVVCFILSEFESAGALHGYRWMHLKCKQAGYNIPRDTVYELMKLLDSRGMIKRKRRRLSRRQYFSPGPNFVWHVDSYDKLKPYGIAINVCIDGYSRHIIWLEAATTNNDPKVIGGYYLESVRKIGGCPKRIRSDLGTENVYIGNMQMFLRREHTDEYHGEKSYIAGKRTHNQRIEWFWGLLRKQMGQYFMDMFADLEKDNNDLYCGGLLDKNLIQFCFLEIIQANLNELQGVWNTHTLQSKTNGIGGARRPILMYTAPQLYQGEDHICRVDENEITICAEETTPKNITCADSSLFELCSLLMEENNLRKPTEPNEARYLYQRLRQLILTGLYGNW